MLNCEVSGEYCTNETLTLQKQHICLTADKNPLEIRIKPMNISRKYNLDRHLLIFERELIIAIYNTRIRLYIY